MLKDEKELNKKILKNKKIWKWTIWNLVLVILGVSIIVNITYLPKYFILKNRSDHTLNIDITAYNNSDDTLNTNLLFLFHYQSTMATVGDLMASYTNTYHLKNAGLGRILTGIYDDSNKKWIEGDFINGSQDFWKIYYNGKEAPVGIDNLKLHMNDKIDLYYEKNCSGQTLWKH